MTPELKGFILLAVIKIGFVIVAVMVGVALLTWAERRVSAWKQDRLGPNRVGPQGLLQPAADGLKNLVKEETSPPQASRLLFFLAPIMAFIPAFMAFAVVPFAAPMPVTFDFTLPLLGRFVHSGPMPMIVADLPVGFLYILAITSLGVYGLVLAGWSSGSKYSLLGGLRSSAQMISYEIAMGLSIIAVLILVGNVTLSEVVRVQQQSVWFVLALTLSFIFFVVSALAETNRLPFDLPETESELVSGYHTEYSSMKFAMFFMAEYANIITGAALITTLFFGGWDVPFTAWDEGEPTVFKSLISLLVFGAKTVFFTYVYIWIRWTLPRFRFDQLMQLGWKFMLPMLLGYIMVIATVVWILGVDDQARLGVGHGLVLFAVNLVFVYGVFWMLDQGRLLVGSAIHRSAGG
jgi:NADH-quinone oxidoreductase subunit H